MAKSSQQVYDVPDLSTGKMRALAVALACQLHVTHDLWCALTALTCVAGRRSGGWRGRSTACLRGLPEQLRKSIKAFQAHSANWPRVSEGCWVHQGEGGQGRQGLRSWCWRRANERWRGGRARRSMRYELESRRVSIGFETIMVSIVIVAKPLTQFAYPTVLR